MFCKTRLNFQHLISSSDNNQGLDKGWYSPEALDELQQLFDALWIRVRKQVFPWDVHATRETLAIVIFRHVKHAKDVEDLNNRVSRSIERVNCGKLRGSRTHDGHLLNQDLANSIVIGRRVYDRAAIDIMNRAYDIAFEQLSEGSKRRSNVQTNMALCILTYFDEGTSDPVLLSRMAIAINTFSDRRCGHRETTDDWCTIRVPITADGPIAF
jgi:hypothetical protein